MNKQLVKDKIWRYEYYHNGYQRLSGADVIVKNLKLLKDRAVADIMLIPSMEDNLIHKHNKCEYSYKELGL